MNTHENSPNKIYIKELNLDMIQPNDKNFMDPEQGGSRFCCQQEALKACYFLVNCKL